MFNISPTGTTITGSYYSYDEYTVDILVSGTCWEIHTGTAEIERVMQVQAYEGQWFVKPNDTNIMVADVRLQPVRRNTRHFASSYDNKCWEFPHHYRAPASIEGNTELIYTSSSTERLFGVALYNHYLFTLNADGHSIIRYDLDTGDTIVRFAAISLADAAFSVISNDWVIYDYSNRWYRLNVVTGEIALIGEITWDSWHHPHWSVIKDVLCLAQVLEYEDDPENPSWLKRQYAHKMYNIWTGELLYSSITPRYPGDANILEYTTDLVVNGDFFWLMERTSENGGTWPEVVGPEPSRIWRMRTAPEEYGGGGSPLETFQYSVDYADLRCNNGDLDVDDIGYNPSDEMVYFIGCDYVPAGTTYVIGKMSPENLSYSLIYSANVASVYGAGEVGRFWKAQDELYVSIYIGGSQNNPTVGIYRLRDMNLMISYGLHFGPKGAYSSNLVDVNHRIWYMGDGYLTNATWLYCLNLDLGCIEYSMDIGIPLESGSYPDFPYRHIVPYNDSLIVLRHNTYQTWYYPYSYDRSNQIYRVT